MSFLTPWFLAGLAAVAVPIIVHLIQRDRKTVVRFPSLMFLERIPFRSVRRQTIRNWPLFLLRLAAIVLLALAFARPFLSGGEGAQLAGGPLERVVLVDRSYSMAWEGSFERALDQARSALTELQDGDRASVIAFDENATVLARSVDPTTARRALDGLTASDRTTRLRPALEISQAILEQSRLGRRDVILISDFQRGAWRGDEDVELPTGTQVTPVPIRPDRQRNVALYSVGLERSRAAARERVTATARLVNLGDAPVTATATLELGGRALESRTVELAAGGEGDATQAVSFQPFTLPGENTLARVRIDDDPLAPDNTYDLVLDPEATPSVLLVEPAGGRANASLYLTRALEIGGEIPFRVATVRADRLTPALVAQHGIVLFNGAAPPNDAVAEALREHLTSGGGLLVALDDRSRWSEAHQDLLPGRFGGPTDRPGAALGYLDYNHPVFELFSTPRSGDFTAARFFRYRAFTPDSTAEVLARFDDGGIALAEGRHERGRTLLWTTGLDNFWNDLALQPVYLPYVHALVRYLSGRSDPTPAYRVGDVVDLSAGVSAVQEDAEAEWLVLTPGGEARTVAPGAVGERFLPLEEAGVYEVRQRADGPTVRRIAANVDRAESTLTELDPDVIVAAIGSTPTDAPTAAGDGRDEGEIRRAQEARTPVGWYLLFVVFGLLALETALSNRASRRPA
ncbi:MAG: BatA domain-containing protein [Gemmatimonadota bacterium]